MASSPTDLKPVLEAVADHAARLCNATDAHIFRVNGDVLRLATSFGSTPILGPEEGIPISRNSAIGRAVVDRHTIYVHDLAAEVETEFPGSMTYQQRFGTRTMVATPLLREGIPVGVILIRRLQVQPSPTSRSTSSRPSPTRLSLPLRTSACSKNSRPAHRN